MNDTHTSLQITTGMATNKAGTTKFHAYMYDKPRERTLAAEWNRSIALMTDRETRDTSVRKVPASEHSSVSGSWDTRNIVVPDNFALTLSYQVKTVETPTSISTVIPLVACRTSPLVELTFPVITDSASTLSELVVQGRLHIPDLAEIEKLWYSGDIQKSRILSLTEELNILGGSPNSWWLSDHFRDCTRTEGSSDFLKVSLGGRLGINETIKIRCLMRGEVVTDGTIARKVGGTKKAQGAVITKKRKRIII